MHSAPSPSLPQMNTWPAGGNPGLPTHLVFALISGSFLLKSVDAGPTKEGSQESPYATRPPVHMLSVSPQLTRSWWDLGTGPRALV